MTNHRIHDCIKFTSQNHSDKIEYIKGQGRCYSCLEKGNLANKCQARSECKKCHRKHPTCLHQEFIDAKNNTLETSTNGHVANTHTKHTLHTSGEDQTKEEDNSNCNENITLKTSTHDKQLMTSMIIPVELYHKDRPDVKTQVYAMLDTQSDATFVLDSTADKLDALYNNTELKLTTMTSTSTIKCRKFDSLIIQGLRHCNNIKLPSTYSRTNIPANKSHIPTKQTAEKWHHLQYIKNEMLDLLNCEIGLLIGYNCSNAMKSLQCITGNDYEPFGLRTPIGWCIIGGNADVDHYESSIVNKVITLPVDPEVYKRDKNHPRCVTFSFQTQIEEHSMTREILKLLESDFIEKGTDDLMMSQNDILFTDKLQCSIHKNRDGHYEMNLPMTDTNPKLPDNKHIATKRLNYLKKRLKGNDKYRHQYTTFMNEILQNDEAELVPTNEITNDCWFLPPHGVFHPKKPDKLRVVFDCSAQCKNVSLNNFLLQGPDFMNSLTGILCRFRKHEIAFMGDVQRMFHQFYVSKNHRDYLRFLWWEDGNIDNDPAVFRMKVHIFGAKSSPGCCNYGLKTIATDYKTTENTEASSYLCNDVYVDDGLYSCPTIESVIKVIHDARAICQNGKLRLHKFISNSKEVLRSLSSTECASSTSTITNISLGENNIDRALGMLWCTETDSFHFNFTPSPCKTVTRRHVLSIVASVFDPLGCLAPFTLIGKQILQELCKEKLDWDDELKGDVKAKWDGWTEELQNLSKIKVNRCLKPKSFGKVVRHELHHFSDASLLGYGCCTYIRFINDANEIHCSLLFAKSRVTLLKVLTIPRLELNAALLAVKMSKMLRFQLKYDNITEYFWTDSEIVLCYLRNDAKRFHIYVANRIQQIKNSTTIDQWQHVKSENNPADFTSRGLHANQLEECCWFSGPLFLWNTEYNNPSNIPDIVLCTNDPEVKKNISTVNIIQICDSSQAPTSILDRIDKFSTWTRAVLAFTMLRRFVKHRGPPSSTTCLQDITDTEKIIIRMVQEQHFSTIIETLKKDGVVNKTTHKEHGLLYQLDPMLDKEGILRVGGRLSRAQLQYGVKHPIILPKEGHVTQLIIRHYHDKIHHPGRGTTIAEIRSNGYWIIGCTRLVSSIIYNCVTCRKIRQSTQNQIMGDLPTCRTEPGPPFEHCGIDCFGPFHITERRKSIKKYGIIVTCLASRAIHIEMLDDMSTDCFVNALRCCIAIRGPITTIYSDQGTNFIGAAHELKLALKNMDNTSIKKKLLDNNCEFVFNPPHASHYGGVWERQIRTIRSVLNGILQQHSHRLDISTVRTFMYETMAIVNSRPLDVISMNDPTNCEPLTPNNLITMKSKIILLPPGTFLREDIWTETLEKSTIVS